MGRCAAAVAAGRGSMAVERPVRERGSAHVTAHRQFEPPRSGGADPVRRRHRANAPRSAAFAARCFSRSMVPPPHRRSSACAIRW